MIRAQQVNVVPYQGDTAWLEPQQAPAPIVPGSFLDVLGLIPLLMVLFVMAFFMKSLQPEVLHEIRLGWERVPPAVAGAAGEVVALRKGIPLPERKALPPGREE